MMSSRKEKKMSSRYINMIKDIYDGVVIRVKTI